MSGYKQLIIEGLWSRNPGLVQFLGICPLLAVSNTAVNGFALGLATTVVLLASNTLVSIVRPWITEDLRLPFFVVIIAALVTAVDLLGQALFFDLWLNLGIFIPLIVTNCVILARAETFASRQPVAAAAVDGLANGLGFAAVLITLGACRELLGNGSLLAGAGAMFGQQAEKLTITLFDPANGFLLAALPPGAFLGLALLIALRTFTAGRQPARTTTSGDSQQFPQKSVRQL